MFRTHVGQNAGVLLLKQIKQAEKSVKISTPYVSAEYAKILTQLAAKDIEIRLLTSESKPTIQKNGNSYGGNDAALDILRKANKSFRDFLDKDIRILKDPKLQFRIIKHNFIHAKLYVIDGHYAVSGSANLTEYGMTKNIEHLIITDSPDEVKQLDKDFDELWTLYGEFGTVENSTSMFTDLWKNLKGKVRG